MILKIMMLIFIGYHTGMGMEGTTKFGSISFKQNYNLNSKESNLPNFLVYTTEFLFSLVWPTLFNVEWALATTYNDPAGSFDVFPEGPLLYIGINSILVPLTIHGIGKLFEKEGNLKNSIIATAISSIPGAISFHLIHKYPDLRKEGWVFLACIIEFSPPLGGVIGYNLK